MVMNTFYMQNYRIYIRLAKVAFLMTNDDLAITSCIKIANFSTDCLSWLLTSRRYWHYLYRYYKGLGYETSLINIEFRSAWSCFCRVVEK